MSKNKNNSLISVFECNVCKRSFDRKASLVMHSRIHLDDNHLTCKFCQKKFLYKYLLNKHLITEGPGKCTGKSNLQFSMNKSRKHSFVSSTVICQKKTSVINNKNTYSKLTNEMPSDKVFECNVCKRSFDRKSSFVLHERTHLDDRPLTCKVCQETFLDKSLLNKHLISLGHIKCTGNDKSLCTEKYKTLINEYKPELTSDSSFKCCICLETFKKECALKDHLYLHIGSCKKSFVQGNRKMSECKTPDTTTLPLCNLQEKFNALQDENNLEVQLNSAQKDTESNACHEFAKVGIPLSEISCLPKEDSSKYTLSDKSLLKDRDKSFQWESCKEVFKYKNLLSEHAYSKAKSLNSEIPIITRKLQDQNWVEKLICTTSYTDRKLTNEMSSDKVFECNVCNRSFDRKSSLVMHERIHLDDKPLTCKICQKTFIDKSLLNKHLITEGHEKCTGTSNLQFSISKNRNNSIVIGTVGCPKNPSVINNKNTARELTNDMSADKGFECNICKKLFDRKSSLILHERTHLDDRPLTCKVCQETFLDKSLLNKHLITLGHIKCMENDKTLCTEKYRQLINEYKPELTSDNSFKCFICLETFQEECTLKDHLYLHIGNCKKLFVQGNGKMSECKTPHTTTVPLCNLQEKFNALQDKHNSEVQLNSSQKDTESNACHEFTKVGIPLSELSCPPKEDSSKYTLSDKLFLKDRDKSFQCEICKEVFKCKNLLSEHVCSKAQSFNSEIAIIRRKLQHQNQEENPIRITSSGKKFSYLKRKSFLCCKCQEVFEKKSSLALHFCTSQKNTVMKTYNRASTALKSDTSKRIDEQNLPVNDDQSLDIQQFICAFCKQHFHNEESLTFHLRCHIEAKFVCEDCQTAFDTKKLLASHRRSIRRKQFLCNVCEKVFCCEQNLNNHCEIHSRKNEFHCDLCDRLFKNKFILNIHYFSHTKNLPFFICPVCLEIFSNRNNWIHHRCIHMGIKPHVCKICKKYFIKRRHFYLHCRIHTDEVPYNCETCHKTFKYHNTLIMHQRNHVRGNT